MTAPGLGARLRVESCHHSLGLGDELSDAEVEPDTGPLGMAVRDGDDVATEVHVGDVAEVASVHGLDPLVLVAVVVHDAAAEHAATDLVDLDVSGELEALARVVLEILRTGDGAVLVGEDVGLPLVLHDDVGSVGCLRDADDRPRRGGSRGRGGCWRRRWPESGRARFRRRRPSTSVRRSWRGTVLG